MKTTSPYRLLASLALGLSILAGLSFAGSKANSKHPSVGVERELPPGTWSLGGRYLGGVDLKLKGLGGFANPRTAGLGDPSQRLDREYDDGFHRADGNADGLTWHWGYQSGSQFDTTADALSLSVTSGLPTGTWDDEETGGGIDFTYSQALGRLPFRDSLWGLRTGFSYLGLDSSTNTTALADVVRTTDSYALGGIIAPTAPYVGTQAGPGPLIADLPRRSPAIFPDALAVDLDADLRLDLFQLSFGPYVEVPLTDRLAIDLSTGVTVGFARSRMEIEQNASFPGLGQQRLSARDSETDFLFGIYAQAGLHYQFTESFGLLAAARWDHAESFTHRADGLSLNYDLGSTVSGVLAFTWRW